MSFTITIVSDTKSWMNEHIPTLIELLKINGHHVQWLHQVSGILAGDLVFYLGCGQIVPEEILANNKHNLVVHASDLPNGRGWSPLTWQILEGKNDIPVTLFEAEPTLDSGKIYLQRRLIFKGGELIEELRTQLARVSLELCQRFIEEYPRILTQTKEQTGKPTFYTRRRPKDSQLDIHKTIKEQFNLLRVVDNERYPAFFTLNDETYYIKISKNIES